MQRRDFLKLAGTFFVSASMPGVLTSCIHGGGNAASHVFRQGVASGDPRSTSVVLWTRVEPKHMLLTSFFVTAEVALDEDFTTLVLQETLEVTTASDYTLRVIVEGLQPDTFYFYRFFVDSDTVSPTGRTLTAPSISDTKPIHFAFVCCQDRIHGFYNAYRRLINDDLAAPADKQIRFILHLGDFIYETRNDPLQIPLDESLNPISEGLIDQHGQPRDIPPFPGGGETTSRIKYANTLDDYRHLYKNYLLDPDLQAARARWPFICVWDDHEFSDDCWQTEANYNDTGEGSGTDEPSQRRKVAANQAWFEYTPVNFINQEGVDADLQHAKEFEFVDVNETANVTIDEENFVNNADNVAAINSITIYRSFHFGQWMELVLTDNRSYRSDHPIPEDISGNSPLFIDARVALPVELINLLDAGKTANNGSPPTFLLLEDFVLNPRRHSPPGTMLGARQKRWWKETMARSDARWKLWGNSVPLQRFLLNVSALGTGLPDAVLTSDTWDGYRTERNELMEFLRNNDIRNIISLSGDVHAHSAGVVMDDYDAKSDAHPSMVEIVCGSISSVSQFAGVEQLSRRDDFTETERMLRSLITYDARLTSSGGNNPLVNNLNNTLLNGVRSGMVAAQTNSFDDIIAAKDPVNDHLVYMDTDAHGFGLVEVTESSMTVLLATIDSINNDPARVSPQLKRTATFTIPFTEPGDEPSISPPTIMGDPPFPLNG